MKKTLLIPIILSFIILTACNKEHNNYVNVDYASVMGKWDAFTTDNNSQISAVIQFKADSTYHMRVEYTFPYELGFINYNGPYLIHKGIISLVYNRKTIYAVRITEFNGDQAKSLVEIDKRGKLGYLFTANKLE